VKKMRRISTAAEIVGRGLLHFSFEPLTFGLGVAALWLHKQLERPRSATTALHGAYDKLEGAEAFQSKTFRWDTPIDEASWRYGPQHPPPPVHDVAARTRTSHFGLCASRTRTPYAPEPPLPAGRSFSRSSRRTSRS